MPAPSNAAQRTIQVNPAPEVDRSKKRGLGVFIMQVIACILLGVALTAGAWVFASFAFDRIGVR